MEKLDGFYKKFPGSYIAYIGFIFSITFISISVFLYSSTDPSFSIFTHFLSDLGAASKSSSLVFNLGMIISAPLRVLFGIYLLRILASKGANKRLIKIIAYAIMIGAIGSFILALFPYDISLLLHMSGALVYFISVIILQSLMAKIELKTPGVPRYLPLLCIAVVSTYILFVGFEISAKVVVSESLMNFACFFEWMGYFSLMIWILSHGYYTQRAK
jgi:hypothetical membrane protein